MMSQKRLAILTCGGICPGLNDVIRGLVQRSRMYKIDTLYGIPYGFKGFYDDDKKHFELTYKNTKYIHRQGGTILGTSREKMEPDAVIQNIQKNAYDTLFIIGGDGGNTAAYMLNKSIKERGLPIQVIGLPKSIDNDIDVIDKCFGFETAVEEAHKILLLAKSEAMSVPRGITIVNVMGRNSGFIATNASLASGVVDICLIPEIEDISIDKDKFIMYIKKVLAEQGNCVICIAEGMKTWDKDTLKIYIQSVIDNAYIKIMDPTYSIRAGVTTSNDHIFCTKLAYSAVDAAISGYTGITVATHKNDIQYFNTENLIKNTKKVSLKSFEWLALQQPNFS